MMAHPQLTRIMQNCRVHLPGALDGAIQLEMYNIMNQFFKESSAWKEIVCFEVNNSTQTYYVIPTLGEIVRLERVSNMDDVGYAATMPKLGEIVLAAKPEPAKFRAYLILTVVDPITRDGFPECPDDLLVQYHAEFVDGIISAMMLQVGKPYSNPNLGAIRGRSFRSAIGKARVAAQHMNLHDAQAWRYPKFA